MRKHSIRKNRHVENIKFTLKPSPNRMKKENQPSEKAHAFTSASFRPNLHHRHTDRRSRTISRKKEFSPCPLLPPLGCVVFCLPKPPPQHTLEPNNFEEEEFVGAWKQTGAAVSHDPKVCFSWFSLFPNLDFELGVWIFCLLHRKVSNLSISFFMRTKGVFWYDLGFVWFLN